MGEEDEGEEEEDPGNTLRTPVVFSSIILPVHSAYPAGLSASTLQSCPRKPLLEND